MKKLWLMVALGLSAACIEWPTEDTIKANRCLVVPAECAFDAGSDDAGSNDAGSDDAGSNDAGSNDAGSDDAGSDDAGSDDAGSDDAGSNDAGSDDAGTDAGADAGIDAGSWSLAWNFLYEGTGVALVGDSTGGTLLAQAPGSLLFRGFTSAGPSGEFFDLAEDGVVSAAYERDALIVVTFPDQRAMVRLRSMDYPWVFGEMRRFAATAVDLYPLEDGGLAVAAYGNDDGGLGVDSFSARTGSSEGGPTIACNTTVMRPLRILPTPDGGPGVVVGNVTGLCTDSSFTAINSAFGGGFVGRFGGNSPSYGFSFATDPNTPMALGIAQNDVWMVYRPAAGRALALAKVPLMPPVIAEQILLGEVTPIELVEAGSELVLVGHGTGVIALADGGSSTTTDGEDVFILRLDADRRPIDLHVFVATGDQRAAGAVWMNDQHLVIGGSCGGFQAGLCRGSGQAWVAGFAPR